jgi:hypothetical protein
MSATPRRVPPFAFVYQRLKVLLLSVWHRVVALCCGIDHPPQPFHFTPQLVHRPRLVVLYFDIRGLQAFIRTFEAFETSLVIQCHFVRACARLFGHRHKNLRLVIKLGLCPLVVV